MTEEQSGSAERGRRSPPLSLREACRRAGLDRHGKRCPDCPVRELCVSELRWLVSAAPPEDRRC